MRLLMKAGQFEHPQLKPSLISCAASLWQFSFLGLILIYHTGWARSWGCRPWRAMSRFSTARTSTRSCSKRCLKLSPHTDSFFTYYVTGRSMLPSTARLWTTPRSRPSSSSSAGLERTKHLSFAFFSAANQNPEFCFRCRCAALSTSRVPAALTCML